MIRPKVRCWPFALLVLGFVLLANCKDDSTKPNQSPYYTIDASQFDQFELIIQRNVFCGSAGELHRILVSREQASYSLRCEHLQRTYCRPPDSLLVDTSTPRALSDAESQLMLETFRHVEIARALSDSCEHWLPFKGALSRWDSRVYGQKCTFDHLSRDTAVQLIQLAEDLANGSNPHEPGAATAASMRLATNERQRVGTAQFRW